MLFRIVRVAVVALALAEAAGASAQASSGNALSPEQVTRIRAHVAQEKRSPARPPRGVRIAVGTELPADIELYSFPGPVGVPDFRYTVIGNQIVLVRRATRKIFYVYGIGF
jgi:Protein of unknown function (DUF1236)